MTGSVGPSCDCGHGGVGSNESLSLLPRLLNLLLPLAFASVTEWGAGGGIGGGSSDGGGSSNAKRSCRWLLVFRGDGSDSKKLLSLKIVSLEHVSRPVAT